MAAILVKFRLFSVKQEYYRGVYGQFGVQFLKFHIIYPPFVLDVVG